MPQPAAILSTAVAQFYKTYYNPAQLIKLLLEQAPRVLRILKPVPSGGSGYPLPQLAASGGKL